MLPCTLYLVPTPKNPFCCAMQMQSTSESQYHLGVSALFIDQGW